jgi:predicted ATPase
MLRSMTIPSPSAARFVRRVKLKNYKSIGRCEVELAPLTVMVGRNGSGKSNFLDALGFVSDSLRTSLDHALRERGGLRAVRRLSTSHPRNFEIEIEFELFGGVPAIYAIKIDSKAEGEFQVAREKLVIGATRPPRGRAKGPTQLRLDAAELAYGPAWYEVVNGEVKNASASTMPPASPDRLYLVTASGLREFRPAYDALTSMGFYSLNPEAMKRPQSPDAGELLHRDGWNIASVIARLERDAPELKQRVVDYLKIIVPGVTDFQRVELGPQETVKLHQEVQGSQHPWTFYAMNMSDGTLRALGTLIAAVQPTGHERVRLVGIEEPETALHPAATSALLDALREATAHTQVLVTTHSPELLEGLNLDQDKLLVVVARGGTTEIAEPDQASLDTIRDHLISAGELLRMDQLEPDREDLEQQRKTLRFFDFKPSTEPTNG